MSARRNPYVGPRALRAGEPLHGRDREVARLYDRVLAERIVLLYSPSGAGKSSLLQAGLIPRLQASGFAIRPVVRVGLEPPTGAPAGVNRYVLSTLLSLEEDVPQARQLELTALAGLTLAQYLARRREGEGEDAEVLVLDQFEELLTVEPTAIAARQAFFAQLGEALRDDRVWLVVAMREDFIAGLDPHRAAIPGKLRATFRLDLLDRTAALAAVQAPALASGVTFRAEAAEQLVDDLRQVRVQGIDGAVETLQGPYVEPVQLQVVCRGLWAALPADAREIAAADVARLGDVDQALARYYDAEVAAAARASKTPERALRGWIGRHLVTANGLRTQVLRTPGATLGLADPALAELVDAHLLRTDTRRGMTWLELAHDRIVAPLLASNTAWLAKHLGAAERQAVLWDSQGRPDALLLASAAEAEALLADGRERTTGEREFLVASRDLRRREETSRRNVRTIRGLVAVIAAMVVAGLAIGVAVLRAGRAEEASKRAAADLLAQEETDKRKRADARAEAEAKAAELARVHQLVGFVALLREQQPDLAALLAVAASRLLTDPWERTAALLHATVTRPQLVARLGPSADAAGYVQLAGAGGRLYARDRRGQVWRLEVATRGARALLPDGVQASDFAPDPSRPRVAVVSARGLEIFDEDGAATIALALPPDEPPWTGTLGERVVEGLRFSGNGARLVGLRRIPGASGHGFVIDVAAGAGAWLDGQLLAPLLAPSPDGELVVAGTMSDNGSINVFTPPLARGKRWSRGVVVPGHAGVGDTHLARFDAAGARLVTGGLGTAATVWRVRGGVVDEPRALPLGAAIRDAIFMPADTLVALTDAQVASFRGDDLAPWGTPVTTPTPGMNSLALVGSDASLLALGFAADAQVHVFDPGRLAPWSPRPLERADPEEKLPHAFIGAAPGIAVDAAGTRVAIADYDGATGGHLRIFDAARREVVATSGQTRAQFMAMGFVGGRVVFVDAAGSVGAWSGTDAQPVSALGAFAAAPLAATLTADGADKIVAVGVDRERSTVTIVAEAGGFAARPLDLGTTGRISAIAAAPGGEIVAVARVLPNGGSEVQLQPSSGPSSAAPLASDAQVIALVFASDARRLAGLRHAAAPMVWDLATHAPIALRVRRPLDRFVAAEFAGAGDVLIAAVEVEGAALDLTLWDLRTGDELAPPLRIHDPAVGRRGLERSALRMAGELVLSSSDDGVVLWDISQATLRAHACALAGRELTDDERRRYLGERASSDPLCPR